MGLVSSAVWAQMKGWASVGHGRPGVKRPQGDKCRGQEAGDTALRTHGGKEGGRSEQVQPENGGENEEMS